MTRHYVSYSQISKYLRCPLSYYFEYVAGLPRATVSSGQVLGTAVHEALAAFHRSLMRNEPVATDQVQDVFLKSWHERIERQTVLFSSDGQHKALIEQGIALIEAYLAEPAPENVVGVEQTLLAPLSNSDGEMLDKPLMAVVDLLVKEGNDLAVVDFKTSAKSYSELEAATSLQPTCYVNNVSLLYGITPKFRFAVLVKTKTPRIQIVPADRSEADLGRLGDIVQMVERAVAAGVFYPVENPLNCSTCPYRSPCREWGPARVDASLIPTLTLRKRATPC